MRKKLRLNFFKTLQIFCLTFAAFYLSWALWTEFSFSSLLFSAACIGGVFLSLLNAAPHITEISWKKILPEYMHYLFWIAVMVIANGFFYNKHSPITFLFITMDAYAIFFIRLLVSVIPFMFFVDTNRFKETRLFKIIIGVILGTNAFYTFRAVQFFPDAIRAREKVENIGAEEVLFATPNYAMVYGLALLIPVLWQKWKNAESKEDKILYLIYVVLSFYIVAVSQFATALIISVVGTLLFFVLCMKNNKRVVVVSIVAFTLFYVHITKIDVAVIDMLANSIDGTWSEKLHDISDSLSGSNLSGSLSTRNDLYQTSLDSFFESPVFGIMANPGGQTGGHSTAIDILGLAGLMGFVPFILTYIYNIRRVCRTCNFNKNKASIIACNVEFIILVFTKNIITSLSVFFSFFVLFPLMLKMENTDERK